MKNKGILTLIGFILFFTGMLSIVLSMIGVNFILFSLLAEYSGSFAFICYMFLVILGLLMVIIPNSDLRNDEEIVKP